MRSPFRILGGDSIRHAKALCFILYQIKTKFHSFEKKGDVKKHFSVFSQFYP